MRRRGAAAAADDIDQPAVREFADKRGHGFRAFVIEAEFIRQAGVGIGADEGIGDARQFGDMGAHFARAERAIEADGKRPGVAQRMPERRRRLAGQGAPGEVGDRAGNHHRQRDARLFESFVNSEQRRLGVERVEDGFDQDQIGSTFDQTARGVLVGYAQFIEGDRAEAGIGDVRRDRGGAVGRPHRAGDEALSAVALFGFDRRFDRETRAFDVQLARQRFHAVIGLGDGSAGEGVGLDDIGAGLEIGEMDFADSVGLGQDQQIVVAAQVARPVREPVAAKIGFGKLALLDHRAHGAVEHEDFFARRFRQGLKRRLAAEAIGRSHVAIPFSSARAPRCSDLRRRLQISAGAARTPSRWQTAKTRSARFIV